MLYPEHAKIKGVKYKLNTSYLTALECFSVVNDESISDLERTLAVIYKLFGFIPKDDVDKFLEASAIYLQRGKELRNQEDFNPDMDFNHDMPYIVASFQSDYHLDLTVSKDMHFYKFLDLINGLTDKSILSRVRSIRNYDLSEIKDEKYKKEMAKAKEQLALPIIRTQEEQEMYDEFEALISNIPE